MLSELKWLNIKDILNFHKMCLVYKYRNGLVPQYLAETFSNVSDKHEHHPIKLLNFPKPNSSQT